MDKQTLDLNRKIAIGVCEHALKTGTGINIKPQDVAMLLELIKGRVKKCSK